MATAEPTGAGATSDAPPPANMVAAFNRFVFPLIAAVVLLMVAGTCGIVILVSTPFRLGSPPPLPDNVTDQYRIYSFYKMDMYNLYIQSENKSLAVHALQVGIGTTLGLMCVFIGTTMCWFGVTGAFAVDAADGTKKFNLQSAQVGTILLIGGIALVSMAIFRTNEIVNTGELAASAPRVNIGSTYRGPAVSGGSGGTGGTGSAGGGFYPDYPPPMTKEEEQKLLLQQNDRAR